MKNYDLSYTVDSNSYKVNTEHVLASLDLVLDGPADKIKIFPSKRSYTVSIYGHTGRVFWHVSKEKVKKIVARQLISSPDLIEIEVDETTYDTSGEDDVYG